MPLINPYRNTADDEYWRREYLESCAQAERDREEQRKRDAKRRAQEDRHQVAMIFLCAAVWGSLLWYWFLR